VKAQAANHTVVIVAPTQSLDTIKALTSGLDVQMLAEAGKGLSRAINTGITAFGSEVTHVGWLGDDDLLAPNSMSSQLLAMRKAKKRWCLGAISVIAEDGRPIEKQVPVRLAVRYARWGRNFIPQPGALFELGLWQALNGLDETLGSAMDLDIFLRAQRVSAPALNREVVAAYRWHQGSISASKSSYAEDQRIRKQLWTEYEKRVAVVSALVTPLTDRVMRQVTKRRVDDTCAWVEDHAHDA
jgi:hypothetical protein